MTVKRQFWILCEKDKNTGGVFVFQFVAKKYHQNDIYFSICCKKNKNGLEYIQF